ncbi:hypothetical protein ABT187_45155 [Streptomyces sp. NPDC001817]|uniref:hypothetical protein n=1 Tax=Streptomyces sp. NPDC001817 TaxID=3154398 RepID=UPI00332F9627
MDGILLASLFGFVTLVTLGIFLPGALTVTIPPLVIGLVATPVMGALTVFFACGRGRAYDLDAHRLYRDLYKLLAPLRRSRWKALGGWTGPDGRARDRAPWRLSSRRHCAGFR